MPSDTPRDNAVVCTFVGDSTVGKTALITRGLTDTFPDEYVTTVFDSYQRQVETPSGLVEVDFWDTSGSPHMELLRPLAYRQAHAFAICYAVDNRDSFYRVSEQWLDELDRSKPDAPLLLIACKVDLRDEDSDPRVFVSRYEGEEKAKEIGASFLETSAIDGINTEHLLGATAEVCFDVARVRRQKQKSCIIF